MLELLEFVGNVEKSEVDGLVGEDSVLELVFGVENGKYTAVFAVY